MAGVSQQRLQFIFWYLLSICTFVAANSNNTCEVLCLCSVPHDYWNQLKCCPESLVQKEIASAQDVNSEPNSPVTDAYPMWDDPVDDGPMFDSSADGGSMYESPDDGGSMWDLPGDGEPMYDNPDDGGSMWENPSSGGPMFGSRVTGKRPVSPPSVREPRSLGQEKGIHVVKKRNQQVKSSYKSSCVSPFVYTEPLHKDFAGADPFRVFHDCLQKFIGSEMYLKCQDFRNVSSLERIIPVVDRKTKIIYANRFCADCNDIEDIETFHHKFRCSTEILGRWDLLSLEQTEENKIVMFRSGLCVYDLDPPDKKTLQTAGNMCLIAKYTNCYHAEDVAVSKFEWYLYNLSSLYLEDGEHCALCGYQNAMPEYPIIGQSAKNTVQGACNYRECQTFRSHFMSYSFFILMSLDEALPTKSDDRVLTPSDLTCGNQSYVIYDKYMVRNIIFRSSIYI